MIYIAISILSFGLMEAVAWLNHKYVMHGFLWKWHLDHHLNDHEKLKSHTEVNIRGLEKNDRFFLVYALPAAVLLVAGLYYHNPILVSIGIGISLYGTVYFTIHDIMIHQRVKVPFLARWRNAYIRAVIEAHLAHHRGKNKHDFQNYGLLVFQKRFIKH